MTRIGTQSFRTTRPLGGPPPENPPLGHRQPCSGRLGRPATTAGFRKPPLDHGLARTLARATADSPVAILARRGGQLRYLLAEGLKDGLVAMRDPILDTRERIPVDRFLAFVHSALQGDGRQVRPARRPARAVPPHPPSMARILEGAACVAAIGMLFVPGGLSLGLVLAPLAFGRIVLAGLDLAQSMSLADGVIDGMERSRKAGGRMLAGAAQASAALGAGAFRFGGLLDGWGQWFRGWSLVPGRPLTSAAPFVGNAGSSLIGQLSAQVRGAGKLSLRAADHLVGLSRSVAGP